MKKTLALLSLMTVAAASHAGLALVTNRADVGDCDTVDWSQFGGSGTTVMSPSAGWTEEGTKFLVSDAQNADMTIFETSGVAGTAPFWGFGAGHSVIYTPTNNGPLTVAFAKTYCAAGADIMVNNFGTYTAVLSAYDALGDFLGSVSTTVVSDANIVGNAPFLGVRSDSSNIARLEYTLTSTASTGGFAIDEMSLDCCCVPEPASMATLAFGLIGIAAKRRAKKARA